MKVRCRLEHTATILPGGHYYDGQRFHFEPAFCCEAMRAAWESGIVTMDETPAVALAEMTLDREAKPRMVSYTGPLYPIAFCPFCGATVEVEVERV